MSRNYRSAVVCDQLDISNTGLLKKNERRFAIGGLALSLIIIAAKVYYSYREEIYSTIFEKELITYEVITDNGEVMMKHAWTTVIRYSSLWLPVLCGFLATYFTWLMVYLDSSVPGVQPPSPFSPTKYKLQSGHTFHLNYVFAVLIGILTTSYMYWKNITLSHENST